MNLDQKVREALGDLMLQVMQQQLVIEKQAAEIKELEQYRPKSEDPKK